ncbi:MAG: spore coat protein U domain-containing protein [Methyloglobulus sp.]|nr:spore coat protein U domain-containing protein [Methyloglobulus sp.]
METKLYKLSVHLALASVLAVCGVLGVNGYAAVATSSLGVTTQVIGSCSITATPLAFGNINVLPNVNIDNQSTLNATCTNGTPYVIGLNAGVSSGATVTARKMTRLSGGSQTIQYRLFSDSARLVNWGNGATVTNGEKAGTGSGVAQPIIVYGRIPPGQNLAPAAIYNDTITATINY